MGTSGFSYPAWRGSFYPPGLHAQDMLPHYSQQLPAVEIDSTFYRTPNPALLETWSAATPSEFLFSLKSHRRITHELRLLNAQPALERFANSAAALGSKLGPVLFQLPPSFPKDRRRLEAFLRVVAEFARWLHPAFEFRHPSWFCDEIFSTLREAGAALCIAESDQLETPVIATASWGYLRLRRDQYSQRLIDAWATRVAEQSWDEAYVYVKHETAEAPRWALRLLEKLTR